VFFPSQLAPINYNVSSERPIEIGGSTIQEEMDMKNKVIGSAAGAVAALLFTCGLTFAKTSHVNLIYVGKAGQLTLAPGTYTVKVNTASTTPEMAFYQNGKLVGTTPVQLVSKNRKNSQTQVYYNAPQEDVRRITQIDLSGWKDTLLFNQAVSSSNHAGQAAQTSPGS
jgi:hypothetical protein